MTKSLEDRFREVDRVPTPWDTQERVETPSVRSSSTRVRAILLAAASLAVAGLAVIVSIRAADTDRPGTTPDASWLLATQGSCVERYSAETLPDRDYAFEGVVAAVQPPADPHGNDPGATATTVTFDVRRWFWGGIGGQISLRTYATPPASTGAVDASIGAHLLASGDGDFLWSCGFTKPFGEGAAGEFEAAAAEAGP